MLQVLGGAFKVPALREPFLVSSLTIACPCPFELLVPLPQTFCSLKVPCLPCLTSELFHFPGLLPLFHIRAWLISYSSFKAGYHPKFSLKHSRTNHKGLVVHLSRDPCCNYSLGHCPTSAGDRTSAVCDCLSHWPVNYFCKQGCAGFISMFPGSQTPVYPMEKARKYVPKSNQVPRQGREGASSTGQEQGHWGALANCTPEFLVLS